MKAEHNELVMAFYPNARGFAFVIFEGPVSLVDWGISDVARKDRRSNTCLRQLSTLLDHYCPDVLVLREREKRNIQALTRAVEALAAERGVQTCSLSRNDIRSAFVSLESPTRYAIAKAITNEIPMLRPFLPPTRKIWNGEDRRMGLFDAAALVLSFLRRQDRLQA